MKILVIALAGIGDCLIATPLIHELRLHYPDAELEAFVFWPGSRELLEGNPHLNAIHQRNLVKDGRVRAIRYLLQLRRRKYDITINAHPQGPIHYRIAAGLIQGRLRLSHRYEKHGVLDSILVNRTLPQDYSLHSIQNNNRLLELLGKKPLLPQHEMEIYLAPAELQWAGEFIQQRRLNHRQRLGLHVGSGGTKVPSRNLRQAAALMKHCHSFLSVDTALMHVATAMKAPHQIVIEAPTLNTTNQPWQTDYRVVRNPMVNGRNLEYYRYDGGPIKGSREHLLACMASIKVQDVYQAVHEAVG
ncbi:MAG: glycosyltransferase family 9 protein [Verrucomicrobia bacterium]|nr:glycosyltransferase family 9 protein [Verrucomicrobiota bacterium]